MSHNHSSIHTILSVGSFPVGNLPVKSFPVKSLSKSDQNGKLSTDKVVTNRLRTITNNYVIEISAEGLITMKIAFVCNFLQLYLPKRKHDYEV